MSPLSTTSSARVVAAALVLALVPLVAGCGSRQDDYCAAVKDHQSELTDITSGSGNDALIRALPIFEDLQSKAPDDIVDDWQQVVGRIKALDQALHDAGVDPATYDRNHPPAGLGADDKARIDAAARELGSQATVQALLSLDQEARDVCQTPLTL